MILICDPLMNWHNVWIYQERGWGWKKSISDLLCNGKRGIESDRYRPLQKEDRALKNVKLTFTSNGWTPPYL